MENIMGMLTSKGAVNPNESARRKAQMQETRVGAGAEPRQTGRPKPPGERNQKATGAKPVGERPSVEEGTETDMTAPQSTIPIIIDALNESIIALKVEIHRTGDPEERKVLEGHANTLRQEIMQLGGEPVYAEESIEEGMAKLTGQGYVANDAIQGLAGQSLKEVGDYLGINIGAVGDKAYVGNKSFNFGEIPHTTFDASKGRHFVQDPAAFMREFGLEAPYQHQEQMYVPEGGFKDQPRDDFSQMLQQIGAQQPGAAPQLTVSPAYVNSLIQQYGLQPRSEQEIAEHARAIVERQKFSQEQIIHRELERMEREHPPEMARAAKQVQEQAKAIAADQQEEFSNRGMYYSSVMGNRMAELDGKTMDIIAEIASDAASHVLDLHADLRDIAQWAILEEEVLKRQMQMEERQMAENLMQIQLQVAMHADQMALDTWYRNESLQMQNRELQLQAVQMQIQEAERAGQHLAKAYLGDTPLIQEQLNRMGISPQQFQQMGLEQRSYLVDNVANYVQMDQQFKMNELQMEAIAFDMMLSERQLAHMIDYDWANYDLAHQQFEHGKSIDWAHVGLEQQRVGLEAQRVGISAQNARNTAAHQAWQREFAERELELANQYRDGEISDEAYHLYKEGLGMLKDGHIDGARGTTRRLGEIGANEWKTKLERDIVSINKMWKMN